MKMRSSSALFALAVGGCNGDRRVFVQRKWQRSAPIRNGSVLQLDRKGDLQHALNEARPGDAIVLQAGVRRPFTLPVKSGTGPFKIINNYLDGAGENVMFGGAPAVIPNLVRTGITFRNNYVFKPLS